MGNSAAIVMKHYFEIVDARAADKYWSIKPLPATDRKIVNIALTSFTSAPQRGRVRARQVRPASPIQHLALFPQGNRK
jgi:hypothetical protein